MRDLVLAFRDLSLEDYENIREVYREGINRNI